ncbi:MAG: DUF305 domain-containing protein [Candidatus Saccharibacteria bacterium]|nr:DUF305 domain-containing protein [Candidatus Saccharibacteria bacterium]
MNDQDFSNVNSVKKHKIIFAIGVFLVVVLMTLVSLRVISKIPDTPTESVTESTTQTPSSDPLASMIQPVQGAVGDEFDAKYVELLFVHNAISTAMANLVKDSQDKEIREFADYIIRSNVASNEKLLTWSKDLKASTSPPKQTDVDTIVANLTSNSGEERDHQFVLDIIDHLAGSTTLSKYAISNSDNSEIKNFANQLITDESTQAETFQKWARTVSFDSDDRQTFNHDKHDNY